MLLQWALISRSYEKEALEMDMNASVALKHSSDEAVVPSRQEIVARANGLRDLLWAGAADSDRNRRLNDTTVAALKDAGINRLFSPRRFGGYEADNLTMLEVTIALARGDASAAWVTGIGTAASYMVGLLPEQAQAEVWSDGPDTRMSAVLAPTARATPCNGGYEVTGRWGYMSGCLHAEWAWISFPAPDLCGLAIAVVPLKDATIEDTWFTTGMRGTGSNTVVADRLFVPSHRVAPLQPTTEGRPVNIESIRRERQSLYRSSFMGVFLLSLVGVVIGEVQAARDIVIEKAPSRGVTTSKYFKQSESVAFQLDLAEGSAKLDTAATLARELAIDVDGFAQRDEYPDDNQRAAHRLKCAWALKLAHEAMEILMSAHGTSAFTESNPLSRLWRNVSVAARHAGFSYRISEEVYGRVLLGLDPHTVSDVL